MRRILLALTAGIVVLWALIQPAEVLTFSAPFFPMRKALITLSGGLAMGWMFLSMLLALRPLWLERYLGGLDKLFWLHKWVGIVAVILVSIHWLIILSPRTLADWGWIETLTRGARHGGHGRNALAGLAREMGEWSATIMIGTGLIAIAKFIPYSWFKKAHKAFPVAFLLGAFHSIELLPNGSSTTLFGLFTILISITGSFIAIYSLMGMIGQKNDHHGHITDLAISDNGSLHVSVQTDSSWPGHKAGQFSLVTFDPAEGAHPFTITSAGKKELPLTFIIKPLGDYTRRLAQTLHKGDPVTLEGPYGGFDFEDKTVNHSPQIWIAGGIGLAPFIARLQHLATNSQTQHETHLFYTARYENDPLSQQQLQTLCQKAGVTLHWRLSSVDGHFSIEDIANTMPKHASVWFCGPSRWGKQLKTLLCRTYHLPLANFHREIFEFR